jgi:hypothetical protein
VSTSANASVLYGLEYSFRELFTLDQANGSPTLVGSAAPGTTLRDLASDTRAESFRIWANSHDSGELWQVNPTTGATTLVGPFNLPAGQFIRALAFDPVTSQLYGTSDVTASLYRINSDTGAATLVGPVGLQNVNGLGADPFGKLYAITSAAGIIYQLDKSTGAATAVSDTHQANLSDLAFRPEDSALFVNTYTELLAVDLNTGASRTVGPISSNVISGIAFGPVPEPGSLWMMASLVALGIASRPRRKGALN